MQLVLFLLLLLVLMPGPRQLLLVSKPQGRLLLRLQWTAAGWTMAAGASPAASGLLAVCSTAHAGLG
jgi:hypothetical protein